MAIPMTLLFTLATATDVDAVVSLRAAVAQDLTMRHGRGHWSSVGSEKSVLRDIRTSHVILAWEDLQPVGTARLANKRPWAINPAYFTPTGRVLYLTDMAVVPRLQGQGIGRRCLEQAKTVAAGQEAMAIRLDAYEGPAGAGEFYAKCGFTERGRVSYRATRLIYYEMLLSPSAVRRAEL
jgi:GNAT superfamily N-acetyltransferase